MSRLFADTAFYLALIDRRDGLHKVALRLVDVAERRGVVTTDYVLIELLNALGASPRRGIAVELVRSLRADADVDVVAGCETLFRQALQLYQARSDKRWSFTDCASFQVMRERGVAEALTADRHFVQAGFVALME